MTTDTEQPTFTSVDGIRRRATQADAHLAPFAP